jgi:WD40 repeat protein
VLSVAITGDGKLAASAGIDGSVKLWDPATGKEVVSTSADPEVPVYAVAFSPDRRTLAVAAGATVRRYDSGPLVGEEPAKEPSKEPSKEPVVQVKMEEAGRLATFRDAAFDVKGGQLFTVTLAGSVKRFEYPSFKQTGMYKMDEKGIVSRVALDVQKKTLHAVRAVRIVRDPNTGVVRETDPELYSFDVSNLQPNAIKSTTKSPGLTAAKKTKLEGEIVGRDFSADGKWLYYLDAKFDKLHKLDTATGKLAKSVDVPKGATGLCVTPDGGTVWVISTPIKDKGRLDRFATADLAKKQGAGLTYVPAEVVATDGGRVCVSGVMGGDPLVALYDAEQKFRTVYAAKPKEATALCLSGDQATVYLTPRTATSAAVVRALPTKADKATISVLVPSTTTKSSAPRELVASPDGEYLITRTLGVVWKLPKK